MKKNKIIKSICVMMTLILIPMLVSCGTEEETGPDPNIGLYVVTGASSGDLMIDSDEIYDEGEGMSFELKEGGTGIFTVYDNEDGTSTSNFNWKRKGNKFHGEGGQAVFDGTVENGVLILNNLNDSGYDFHFECKELMK
jgi:hypothetical protein